MKSMELIGILLKWMPLLLISLYIFIKGKELPIYLKLIADLSIILFVVKAVIGFPDGGLGYYINLSSVIGMNLLSLVLSILIIFTHKKISYPVYVVVFAVVGLLISILSHLALFLFTSLIFGQN